MDVAIKEEHGGIRHHQGGARRWMPLPRMIKEAGAIDNEEDGGRGGMPLPRRSTEVDADAEEEYRGGCRRQGGVRRRTLTSRRIPEVGAAFKEES